MRSSSGTDRYVFRVARTEWQFGRYDDVQFAPMCFDAEGMKRVWPVHKTIAELRAKGVDAKVMQKTIEDGFKSGKFKGPQRAGLSYMISPMIAAISPLDHSTALTYNVPHFMVYAPNVLNTEIGGIDFSTRNESNDWLPFIAAPKRAPSNYMIVPLGKHERKKVTEEHKDLLIRLCKIKKEWCLKK